MRTLRLNENAFFGRRSERFFRQKSIWFFKTREGIDIGPFKNIYDAKEGASDYIDFITQIKSKVLKF
ncbi:hypothetical protein H0A36_08260 [Endozoicomonas sp. SM1973]|uniref:DUF6316 domain-containing protein n=1 Tax=Spartinivicinus marinus TaxID=2994442 RepID=A0A853I9R0_9GAMM|nr:DUF6316 family protein [Spartinivicinus marinus]MCX4025284.1 DUF6316 family protein [Spartinivicinus marinus]NYZ66005.1 hypothetical protein [Spartinivicinus marinus]